MINLYKSYLIGFILSIILTIIPFYMVYYHSSMNIYILRTTLVACSIAQILVHLVYFLHLEYVSNKLLDIISLVFTIFIVFILVLGSIWIMMHLHHNLMIGH